MYLLQWAVLNLILKTLSLFSSLSLQRSVFVLLFSSFLPPSFIFTSPHLFEIMYEDYQESYWMGGHLQYSPQCAHLMSHPIMFTCPVCHSWASREINKWLLWSEFSRICHVLTSCISEWSLQKHLKDSSLSEPSGRTPCCLSDVISVIAATWQNVCATNYRWSLKLVGISQAGRFLRFHNGIQCFWSGYLSLCCFSSDLSCGLVFWQIPANLMTSPSALVVHCVLCWLAFIRTDQVWASF